MLEKLEERQTIDPAPFRQYETDRGEMLHRIVCHADADSKQLCDGFKLHPWMLYKDDSDSDIYW